MHKISTRVVYVNVSTHGLSVSLSLSHNIVVPSKVDMGIQVVKNWTSCRAMCLEEPATLSFPRRGSLRRIFEQKMCQSHILSPGKKSHTA